MEIRSHEAYDKQKRKELIAFEAKRKATTQKNHKDIEALRAIDRRSGDKNDSRKEIDIIFKKNNSDIRDLNSDYKEKLVKRFWNLFEDKNNRTEIWRNLS